MISRKDTLVLILSRPLVQSLLLTVQQSDSPAIQRPAFEPLPLSASPAAGSPPKPAFSGLTAGQVKAEEEHGDDTSMTMERLRAIEERQVRIEEMLMKLFHPQIILSPIQPQNASRLLQFDGLFLPQSNLPRQLAIVFPILDQHFILVQKIPWASVLRVILAVKTTCALARHHRFSGYLKPRFQFPPPVAPSRQYR
ncbi:hypothetical protein C8J56DRAFT_141508 [Mycena floridula]|nr:hypothetical protein C8J56DRAFT_141508 [Mycena floridula]